MHVNKGRPFGIPNRVTESRELGQRLAEERVRLGLTQGAMADATHVGRSTQGLYETGKNTPDARYLITAAGIGVDIVYVLFGERSYIEPSEGPQLTQEEEGLLRLYRDARRNNAKADGREVWALLSRMQRLHYRDRCALLRLASSLSREL